MTAIKCLHIADFHLGADLPRLGAFGKRRAAEKVSTLWRILAYCQDQGVDFLLIAGDLFEGRPDRALLHEVQDRMASLPDLRVVIVAGNHDYYALDSAYADPAWPDNVYIFDGEEDYFDFPDKKTRIYGASFLHSLEKKSLLKGLSFADPGSDWLKIGLFHGTLVSPGGASDYNPIDLSALPPNFFSYIALGHVHKRSEVRYQGQTGYAYAGNPDGSAFDELGLKGGYLAELAPGRAHFSFLPFSSRLFIRQSVDLTGIENQREAEDRIRQAAQAAYAQAWAGNGSDGTQAEGGPGGAQEGDGAYGRQAGDEPDGAQAGDQGRRDYREGCYRFYLTGRLDPGFHLDRLQLGQELGQELTYLELRDRLQPAWDLDQLAAEENLRGFYVQLWQAARAEAGEEEKTIVDKALRYGLAAFEGKEDILEDFAAESGSFWEI